MSVENEMSSYEKRMEKMNDAFKAWWADWGDTPEEVKENDAFYDGVSREVAEAIFTAGYRMGGHIPWVSLHPTQVALLGKLFAEKQNEN